MPILVFCRQAACGLAFFLAGTDLSHAGSFQVSPVNPVLSSQQQVVALTLRNTGSTPAVIQLQAMAWAQRDGKDVYVAAPDILGTPPIFTVPAGGIQIVRVGSRQMPDASIERAYRLYLSEIPPPSEPGFVGMRMALRINLPLFVNPVTPATPRLQWRATRDMTGRLHLQVSNEGRAHAHLSGLRLFADGSTKPLPISADAIYVLAGASHDWSVDASVAKGTSLHLTAQTDTTPVQADVFVVSP